MPYIRDFTVYQQQVITLAMYGTNWSFCVTGAKWGLYWFLYCQQWERSIFIWPNSPIPQRTCSISHNATFRTEMCTLLFWMMLVGYGRGALWDLLNWSIRFLRLLRSPMSLLHGEFDKTIGNIDGLPKHNIFRSSGGVMYVTTHVTWAVALWTPF